MLLFHTPWVLQQMGRPDRTAILLELMIEHNMVQPSMSDEELLEAIEAVERQQKQPERDDDTDMFEFSDEFLDTVKSMEEEPVNKIMGHEEEQEQEAMPVQPFEEVSFFCFLFLFFLLCSPFFPLEQFFPSKLIGDWSWPLFLDGDK